MQAIHITDLIPIKAFSVVFYDYLMDKAVFSAANPDHTLFAYPYSVADRILYYRLHRQCRDSEILILQISLDSDIRKPHHLYIRIIERMLHLLVEGYSYVLLKRIDILPQILSEFACYLCGLLRISAAQSLHSGKSIEQEVRLHLAHHYLQALLSLQVFFVLSRELKVQPDIREQAAYNDRDRQECDRSVHLVPVIQICTCNNQQDIEYRHEHLCLSCIHECIKCQVQEIKEKYQAQHMAALAQRTTLPYIVRCDIKANFRKERGRIYYRIDSCHHPSPCITPAGVDDVEEQDYDNRPQRISDHRNKRPQPDHSRPGCRVTKNGIGIILHDKAGTHQSYHQHDPPVLERTSVV